MTEPWIDRLASDRTLLGRFSTAEWLAEQIRDEIIEGSLRSEDKLSDKDISEKLKMSRNTVREAFRLLSHERLLVHELHRGVFVRRLDADDVLDLYRVRRIVESSALHSVEGPASAALAPVHDAVAAGRRAAAERHWRELGTANMRFHEALVALAGSPRLNEIMRRLIAELRLAFQVMDRPREFHEPYLDGNAEIAALLEGGDVAGARTALAGYLDRAERQLVDEMRRKDAAKAAPARRPGAPEAPAGAG
ncbi:GntR family transcriptional regulator [Allonocardiopsis opalescens]|uniref:GntR family transcriptional regulator n=1 Tax=Allonocardiopsis opalescens TaxID=1144618 RepID=A0A2T0PUL7_9ACTN|nr:GntR family transcriptional regulator [Allonocardiopsis opalescens]